MSDRPWLAEAATLLTGLSVPLLLFARQAHYYPEGILLTLLVIRAYRAVLSSRPFAITALVVSATLLFHTNFVWSGLLGVALALHIVVLRPSAQVVGRLAGAAVMTALLVLPFAVWAQVWTRSWVAGGRPPLDPYFFLAHVRHYVLELNLHGAPIFLLLLGGAVAAVRRQPLLAIGCILGIVMVPIALAGPHTAMSLWFFTGVLCLLALVGLVALLRWPAHSCPRLPEWRPGVLVAIISVIFVVTFSWAGPYPFFRYVTPLLPLLAFFSVQSVFVVFQHRWLACAVVAFVVISNSASVWPIRLARDHFSIEDIVAGERSTRELTSHRLPAWTRVENLYLALFWEGWRFPLVEYLNELTHPFTGPIDEIADYLNFHKKPGDRFYTPYGAHPIAFHTGLTPQRLDLRTQPPRWFIPRAHFSLENQKIGEWIRGRRYREIVLDAIDTPYENRPEPDLHRYRAAREGPRVRIGLREE
jgi:hypothetical protein